MPDDELANLLRNKLIASHFSMGARSIQHEVPCNLAVTVCSSMMMIYTYMYMKLLITDVILKHIMFYYDVCYW